MTEDPFNKKPELMSEDEMQEAKERMETAVRTTVIMGKINERRNIIDREKGFVEISWDELMADLPRDIERSQVEKVVQEMFSDIESVWRAEIGEDTITLTYTERDTRKEN